MDTNASKALAHPPAVRDRHDDDANVGSAGGAVGSVSVSDGAAMISMIDRAARDPNVDLVKFERLMEMKMRVDAEMARKAYANAISGARGEIKPILKNRVVDFTSQKGRTNYRHEDLAEVARTVDPVLEHWGLSYRFRAMQSGQKVSVTCIVSHRDGYSEETTLEAGEDHSGNKNSIQAIGSVATYLQRYTLKLALGLAASVDDDATAAGAKALANAATLDDLEALIANPKAATTAAKICEAHSVGELGDLSPSQITRACGILKKRIGG